MTCVGDEPEIGARICRADRGRWQIRIERQIEPDGPVLQSGQQQHFHRVEADGAKPQRLRHGLFDLMLMEILHQPQHLDELAPPGIAHPRFHQPPQTMNAFGKLPAVERRGLIERLALVFQQSQIMQRIVDKLRLVVAADMGGDRLAATGDLDPVDISLRQNLLMAIARRNRIIVVAVTHQRQGRDARRDLVAGVIGRRRQRHERGDVRLHALGDRRGVAAQDRLTPFDAGVEKARVERVKTLRDRQRRHEVAPDIADQPFHLALVVSLARPAEAVVEQVMALKFREHMRAQPLSALDDPGHCEPGVVV